MLKSLIAASMLFVAATTAVASDPQDWCPTLLQHAETMLTQQTDADLFGKITVPDTLRKEDTRAYRKLMGRGRFLLKRYHNELTVETMLNLLKSDCADIYNPTRNGTF